MSKLYLLVERRKKPILSPKYICLQLESDPFKALLIANGLNRGTDSVDGDGSTYYVNEIAASDRDNAERFITKRYAMAMDVFKSAGDPMSGMIETDEDC